MKGEKSDINDVNMLNDIIEEDFLTDMIIVGII